MVWFGGGLSVLADGEVNSWGLFDDGEGQEQLEGVLELWKILGCGPEASGSL